jgi:hypothetical protein
MNLDPDEVKAMGLYAYEVARERLALEGPPSPDDSGWVRYRHCTRKVRHHEQPEVLPGWTYAYRCNYCEGYHITGKPRTGRHKHSPSVSSKDQA